MADSKEYKIFKDYHKELLDILSTNAADLTMVGSAFAAEDFIQEQALNNILQEMPKTATKQAHDLMNAVSAQIGVSRKPDETFKKFCAILKNDKVLASAVAETLEEKCGK